MSKTSMITMMCCTVLLILSGCTGKEGIIRLNTDPAGAHYYVDGVERGTTPAEFEW
ncbi:MAG: PEGA domain-containing protein, partial [Proteobacteria bacterium]|nr:PEGA domain-containing protein [Pseudomonadota bacterium]